MHIYIYSYYDIKFQAPFSPNMALSNKCPTLQTWIRDAEHFVPDRVFEKQPRFRANPGFTADLKGRWWFGACLVFLFKVMMPILYQELFREDGCTPEVWHVQQQGIPKRKANVFLSHDGFQGHLLLKFSMVKLRWIFHWPRSNWYAPEI